MMNPVSNPYAALRKKLQLEQAWPVSENWSAAADFLEAIVDYCLESKPQTIVECSSGLTSLVLARCCQINGVGHVFSLENGAEYAMSTRTAQASYDLASLSSVIDAPLIDTDVHGKVYQWYDTSGLPGSNIDMLVIDGPPGFIQKHSRYPALPVLFERLSANAAIFMDDAARDEEKEIVELWCSEYPGLDHEYLDTERGCSILCFNP